MKEPLKNLTLLAGTLLVLLITLEMIARYKIDPVSRTNFTGVPKTIRMPSPYPDIKYLLRPKGTATQKFGTDPRNYFDEGSVLTYRTNSLGFRGPEVTAGKPEGITRIVGLGDSFTFGTGVRNEHTFLSVLQKILETDGAGRNVQVLNLGAPAYNTVDEINLLRYKGLAYDPDIVVICFFLNDAGGGGSARQFIIAQGEQSFWRKTSRIIDYIASLLERRHAAQALVSAYEKSFVEKSPGWIDAKHALNEAKILSEEENFKIILAIFPVLWGLSDDYPFSSIHRKINSYAEGLSIPVLDLQPAFDGFDGPELWVHPGNQHPNEIAHKVAAETLARFILESDILP